MKNIKNFDSFINESSSNKYITPENFLEYKSKILTIIALQDDPELKKAYDFTVKNIDDYSDDFVKELVDPFITKVNNIIKKNPKFWESEDSGYSGYKTTGKKYELTKDLDIKEIAKLIKKELDIEFPEWKFSVKISRYSGGQSLGVKILDLPYNPYSEEYNEIYLKNENPAYGYRFNTETTKYNELFLKDRKKIEKITNQYNFDDSDSQTDYFHVNYYSHINLDEHLIMKKYYPEHMDVKKHEEFEKTWSEKAKKAKEIADAKKGKFKKGDKIIYIYDGNSQTIPKGEYEGVVLKSPNGRGRGFSTYTIRFSINKKLVNGVEVELQKPMIFTTDVYNDSKLKAI